MDIFSAEIGTIIFVAVMAYWFSNSAFGFIFWFFIFGSCVHVTSDTEVATRVKTEATAIVEEVKEGLSENFDTSATAPEVKGREEEETRDTARIEEQIEELDFGNAGFE